MPLHPGSRIGPYEVIALIGEGGMGQVFRARDTKLNREVALKVLPDSFANDAERLVRFTREAQTLASLNHPNIAHIHGLEESAGVRALVMELVEGEDLSQRIARGAIPVDEALPIAKQVAEALEAAHEQGIIHRDLKPANIKVRPDGTVKVLDFGLAKALEPMTERIDATGSPTITSPAMTHAGMILGTAGYMAPEQARGKPVDRRTDIWAFGCVLYEMLTGKRAYEGEEVSDTLAMILRGEPDWSPVSPPLRRLLRACLDKDRKQRLQAIGDYRLLLDDPNASPAPRHQPRWMIATAVAALVAFVIGIPYFRGASPVEPVRRFSVAVPENALIGFLALSPDGRQLVMNLPSLEESRWQLWRRSLDSADAQPLEGTELARAPFWSPDARHIGFFVDGKLKTMPSSGGPAQELCDTGVGQGGTWNADNRILFGNSNNFSIDTVSASGGPCVTVIEGTRQLRLTNPVFLPDGQSFLYLAIGDDSSTAGLYVASGGKGPGRRLLPDQSSAIFAPPRDGSTRGHVLFLRDNKLVAQSFDTSMLALIGDPVTVAENAVFGLNTLLVGASVANDGTLLHLAARPQRFQRTWFDRTGKELGAVGPNRDGRHVALSPDGQTIAITHDQAGWLYNVARSVETRFASPANQLVWSPDGSRIAYTANGDIFVQDTSDGKQELLVQTENAEAPSDWSRDGRFLVYTVVDPKMQGDIWIVLNPLDTEANRKQMPFLQTKFVETQGHVSPDGRWMAYVSDESGRNEVYVRPFPDGAGKWRISANGGREPSWRADGRELFYLDANNLLHRLMSVPIPERRDQAWDAEVPTPLFEFLTTSVIPQGNVSIYSPSADGSRFLIAIQAADSLPTLNVITNWQQLVNGSQTD